MREWRAVEALPRRVANRDSGSVRKLKGGCYSLTNTNIQAIIERNMASSIVFSLQSYIGEGMVLMLLLPICCDFQGSLLCS